MRTYSFLLALAALAMAGAPKAFKELGDVAWTFDKSAALADSTKTGKPVLAFHTELPGCAGCVHYGQTQLTHPLVVDAAKEFVPLAIQYVGWPKTQFLDAAGMEI